MGESEGVDVDVCVSYVFLGAREVREVGKRGGEKGLRRVMEKVEEKVRGKKESEEMAKVPREVVDEMVAQ